MGLVRDVYGVAGGLCAVRQSAAAEPAPGGRRARASELRERLVHWTAMGNLDELACAVQQRKARQAVRTPAQPANPAPPPAPVPVSVTPVRVQPLYQDPPRAVDPHDEYARGYHRQMGAMAARLKVLLIILAVLVGLFLLMIFTCVGAGITAGRAVKNAAPPARPPSFTPPAIGAAPLVVVDIPAGRKRDRKGGRGDRRGRDSIRLEE